MKIDLTEEQCKSIKTAILIGILITENVGEGLISKSEYEKGLTKDTSISLSDFCKDKAETLRNLLPLFEDKESNITKK